MSRTRAIVALASAVIAVSLLAGCAAGPTANDGANTTEQLGRAAVEMEKQQGITPPPSDEAGQ